MVILIGGPPGAGKTTLGIRLGGRLGWQTSTIDDIRTTTLEITSPASHPELHRIGLPNPWTYFTSNTPETMVEHAISQHQALWPGIARLIRKRLSGAPFILDGWHLMPNLVAQLETAPIAVWLDLPEDVIEDRERRVWDFYAKSPKPELMFANFVQRSTLWNDIVRQQAFEHGYPVIHQDGTRSVDDLADEVLGHLPDVRTAKPSAASAHKNPG